MKSELQSKSAGDWDGWSDERGMQTVIRQDINESPKPWSQAV